MASNLDTVMTHADAVEHFDECVLPWVVEQYEQDGVPDLPARREAWNVRRPTHKRFGVHHGTERKEGRQPGWVGLPKNVGSSKDTIATIPTRLATRAAAGCTTAHVASAAFQAAVGRTVAERG